MKRDYRDKIKTLEQLGAAIGRRPRGNTVIMCHGAFDIVHPGHLRHLMYAKEKADVLIASITADEYISKANHRPFVPQELRAANLAALEHGQCSVATEPHRGHLGDDLAQAVSNIGVAVRHLIAGDGLRQPGR